MTAFAPTASRPVPFNAMPAADLPEAARLIIATAAMLLLALCGYALLRWLLGHAPATPWVRDVALATHLVTVIPAIALGAYVILSRKGNARHRLLGKIWLALMFVTALSTLFIRHFNDGS